MCPPSLFTTYQGIGQQGSYGHHLYEVSEADQEGQQGSQKAWHHTSNSGGLCVGRHIGQEPEHTHKKRVDWDSAARVIKMWKMKLNNCVDLLKQEAVPRHGIDDPGHGEQWSQEGNGEPSYGAHRHYILCEHTAMHGEHLHERGVCVDLIVRYHQGQDHRNLDGR